MLTFRKHYEVPGVYRILNLINGKVYIGSAVDCWDRAKRHKRDLRVGNHKNRHLQAAWNEYGEESFWFSILRVTPLDRDALLKTEQIWLDSTKSYYRDRGYNIDRIAGSRLGTKLTAEQRKKISDTQRGRKQSAETRATRSRSMTGVRKSKKHAFNISLSQAFFSGEKLEELFKLRLLGWSSIKLAGHFGCSKSTVTRTLRGKQTAHNGLVDPIPQEKKNTGQFVSSLSDEIVASIRLMSREGCRDRDIAKFLGVNPKMLWQIKTGKTHKHVKEPEYW